MYGGIGRNSQKITYVSVAGNLIVLYDYEEYLNGFFCAAETIRKVKLPHHKYRND